MARFFITGASGFIGAALARALVERGDEVHAFVRPHSALWGLEGVSFTRYDGDLTDVASVERAILAAAPDTVLHLAGYGARSGTESDEARMRSVIVDGTTHLYAACRKLSTFPRVVHAGSAAEYGTSREYREDIALEPKTAYGRAKAEATMFGETLREEGLPVSTLRLFNAYGPYARPESFITATTLALLRGATPTLSNGATVRDFIYISDIVDAFLRATTATPGIYNVGTGVPTTLSDAATIIHKALGVAPAEVVESEGRGNDAVYRPADMHTARTVLGFAPKVSIEDGIARTVAWCKEHEADYR